MRINIIITLTAFIIVYGPMAIANQKLVLSLQEGYLSKICGVIVSEALKTIDIDIEYSNLPGKRASRMANISDTDGEVCRIKEIDQTLKNLIRIEPSITTLEANVFTINKTINIEQDGWELLKPYFIGIHAGHFYSANGTKGFPHVSTTVKDINLIRKLNDGLIDLAIMVTPDAMYAIGQARKTNILREKEIIMLKPSISIQPVYLYLNKKHEHLFPAITGAIKNIVENGRAKMIYNTILNNLQNGDINTISSVPSS